MKELKISNEVSLPTNTATQKLAWLGTTGSGKTYGASKLAELFWSVGAQFVVLDPVGVWYGLRLAKDGKKPSHIDIPIFGGLHGDVPLEPTAGELIANLVVDKGLSCILDVSQFESDADKARFASAFASRFFFRKKAAPSAVHLFLEECQEFVPQNPQRGEEKMLHDFTRMQKLGRNFGIGSSYISQRPQEVNKKALNMAQTLFVFRNTGTHERNAIEKWIEDKSLDQSIANDLPKIPTGQCHIWSPEFLKISEMVHILEKETFNASATPEVGSVAKSRKLAPIDLEKVKTDMAATIEKAKSDDPKLLKQEIIQLKRELVDIEKKKSTNSLPMGVSQWMEYGKKYQYDLFFENKLRGKLRVEDAKEIERLTKIIRRMDDLFTEGRKIAGAEQLRNASVVSPSPSVERPVSEEIKRQHIPVPPERTEFDSQPALNDEMGFGEKKILLAIAQYDEGITTEHIAVLTSYRATSRREYLRKLLAREYIKRQGEIYFATREGIDILGSDLKSLPTGKELIEFWLNTLPEGERKIFRVLLDAQPNSLTNEEIMEAANYRATSVREYLRKLNARKIVVTDRGSSKVSDKI